MTVKKLNILITGALGNLGREFIKNYSSKYTFAATDCSVKCEIDDLPYLQCDIKNKDECQRLFNWSEEILGSIDGFVHCGAVSSPGNDQELTFEVNAAGTFYLLQACAKRQVENIVLITSGWVQGLPSSEIKPRSFPIDENTVGIYKDVYHISKKFNEMNGKMLTDSDQLKKIISLRLGGIVDVEKDGLKSLSTDSYWTRVALQDCASAIDCALDLPCSGFEYFLIGSKFRYGPKGELETLPQLKEKLSINGYPDLTESFENHEAGQQTYCLDKSFEVLKYKPKF